MGMDNNPKLAELAFNEGYDDVMELLERDTNDSVATGICTNEGCDFSTQVEPDSASGWCEVCETNTVSSSLVLAGII